MGGFISKVWSMMFPAKEYMMVHLGEVVTTHPTVGINVEELVYKNLQFEIKSLKKKVEVQDAEIQKLQKLFVDAQETSKCSFVKEVMNSVAIQLPQLREMTRMLPPELLSGKSFKDTHSQVEAFLSINSASAQKSRQDETSSDNDSVNGEHHRSINHLDIAGGNLLQNGEDTLRASDRDSSSLRSVGGSSSSSSSRSEGQKQVIEQVEPGVYVTLIQLPNGTKVFKRIRFSRRWFTEQQAEEWWHENKERVLRKYPSHAANSTLTQPSTTPAPSDDTNIPTSSS